MSIRLVETKSWLKNGLVCLLKNGCGHSGHRNLKLSQEWMNPGNIYLFKATVETLEKVVQYVQS